MKFFLFVLEMMCEVWSLKSNANETDKEVTLMYVYGPRLKILWVSVGRKVTGICQTGARSM